MMRRNNDLIALPIAAMALLLTSCSFNNPQSSPDVVYSNASNEARALQIPPDLTNVSNGEQFILPGKEQGPLARNRLLPTFSTAQYVRRGNQNWLELDQPAEAVWPLVLEFIRKQKIVVEKTEPTTGLIFTQWRSDNEKSSGGILKNLISSDELFSRYTFRLERNNGGTRVFARSMQLAGNLVEQTANDKWPASSHDPEQVSQVLTRMLVYFGAEEQKAKGILSEPQANAVLDDAQLQTTAAGSQLVVHKGFAPAFSDVKSAIDNLAYKVLLSDGSVGTIQVSTAADAEPMLISLTPLHISAVRVLVTQAGGTRLEKEQELAVLSALREQIIGGQVI